MNIKSQNVFEALSDDDSDHEVKQQPKKLTKKDKRAKEAFLREGVPTHVPKDTGYKGDAGKKTYPKREGKREYERHSGTG